MRDNISITLTRIKNAYNAKNIFVAVPFSHIIFDIANSLKFTGFISDFEIASEKYKKIILITLKYIGDTQKPAIKYIKRVSKPGKRIFTDSKIEIKSGIALISTNSGIISNIEANKKNLGGELICYIK